jgi:hypothetical protein
MHRDGLARWDLDINLHVLPRPRHLHLPLRTSRIPSAYLLCLRHNPLLFDLSFLVCVILFSIGHSHLHRYSHNACIPHWSHGYASSNLRFIFCFRSTATWISLHRTVGTSDRIWYPGRGLFPLPGDPGVSMSIELQVHRN